MTVVGGKYKPKCMENWEKAENYMGEDLDRFYLAYSRHRDSTLISESNFETLLEKYGEKEGVERANFGHWAVGWVESLLVHEQAPDEVLEAIDEDICYIKEEYPLLDEDDYFRREVEQTVENIAYEGGISEDEAGTVYSWLNDNRPNSIESVDDRGGYPDEDDIDDAMLDLMKSGKVTGKPFKKIEDRFGKDAVEYFKQNMDESDWRIIEEEDSDWRDEAVGDIYKRLRSRGGFHLSQFSKGQRKIE